MIALIVDRGIVDMVEQTNTTEAKITLFRRWVEEASSQSIVFFGGAGVSTESGIPDFRSSGGLFSQKYPYPPEKMVSRSFFDAHTAEFYDFYCEKMLFLDAQPNQAHRKLADLEKEGKLKAVITQNIDGLHQQAGSKQVIELHGGASRNFCRECNAPYSLEELLRQRSAATDGIPRCPDCGGIIKPDVVLYEEPLAEESIGAAIQGIREADMLIIAGTSLVVYPAAGLVDYFQGSHLVIINRAPTQKDHFADLCLAADVGRVFDF